MLFDLYYKPLCFYVMQFTLNMPDAEDIVQTEYMKLWDKRNELKIHTSIKSYLYKSVYNAFMLQLRKEKQRDKFLDSLKHKALAYRWDEDDKEHAQKIERIKKLVGQLPDRCREIVLLSKKEGYKNQEIADKLGISVKTVESQIRIAFKKIREGFGDVNLFLFLLSRDFQHRYR